MNQNNDSQNLNQAENTFGTGFVLGAAAASLAIFFLTTKTGKAVIKNLNLGNFDIDKFTQSLKETLENVSWQNQFEEFGNRQQKTTEPNFENEQLQKPTGFPLGKRFFHRRK